MHCRARHGSGGHRSGRWTRTRRPRRHEAGVDGRCLERSRGARRASAASSAKVWLAPRNARSSTRSHGRSATRRAPQYGQFLVGRPGPGAVRADRRPGRAGDASGSTGAGLTVTAVGADNRFVAVSGSGRRRRAGVRHAVSRVRRQRPRRARAARPTSRCPARSPASSQAVTGLTTFGHRMKPADFGPPDAFVPGQPCSDYYGQQIAVDAAQVPRQDAADERSAATCRRSCAAPTASTDGLERSGLDRRDHRRVRRADARRATPTRTRCATAISRSRPASSATAASPRTPRPARTAAATAGTASRRSTSRPCTGWRPPRTSSTTAPRAASTTICSPSSGRSWPTTRPRSSPTRGASRRSSWSTASSSARSTSRSSTPTRASSSRAPCRGSGSTSPPATTATTSRRGATSTPTIRPATRG